LYQQEGYLFSQREADQLDAMKILSPDFGWLDGALQGSVGSRQPQHSVRQYVTAIAAVE
jgi:hypothetical protein